MSTASGIAHQVQATAVGTDIEIRVGDTVVAMPFASTVDLQHELDHALAVIVARAGQRL